MIFQTGEGRWPFIILKREKMQTWRGGGVGGGGIRNAEQFFKVQGLSKAIVTHI